ncbi:hypothetical protein [Thaumasiovibrio sp. DFM-14]|uniref:hypothetical protein n=1 Tax=Thaumasiovibrio sp. DFM-14 TaxID=3384792 RepID=UPI0039A07C3A
MRFLTTPRTALVLSGLALFLSIFRYQLPAEPTIDQLAKGHYWTFSARSYPRNLGSLNQLPQTALMDIDSESHVKDGHLETAMRVRLLTDGSIIGSYTVYFISEWTMTQHNFITIDIASDSITLLEFSDNLNEEELRSFVNTTLLDIFTPQREVIHFSEHQLIIELPYLGITRLLKKSHPTLLPAGEPHLNE